MVEAKNHSLEKAEVEHVLTSGIFDRSLGLGEPEHLAGQIDGIQLP